MRDLSTLMSWAQGRVLGMGLGFYYSFWLGLRVVFSSAVCK